MQLGAGLAGRAGYISEGEIVTFGFSYRAGKFGVDYALASVAAEDVNLVGARFVF